MLLPIKSFHDFDLHDKYWPYKQGNLKWPVDKEMKASVPHVKVSAIPYLQLLKGKSPLF